MDVSVYQKIQTREIEISDFVVIICDITVFYTCHCIR